jgi:phosphoribosylanthranilate isomerase
VSDSVRVKLCGLASAADVRAAVAAGADYLGFVLAPGSPRTLEPAALVALLRDVDTGVAQRVVVVRDQPAAWINEIVGECGVDFVQLHGREPRDFPAALAVPAWRVRHLRAASGDAYTDAVAPASESAGVAATADAERAPAARVTAWAEWAGAMPLPPNVFAVLLDTDAADGRGGGRGRRADPVAIRAELAALPAGTRAFVAGGLTPENVAATVRRFRPWGVDVSSGVESAPGVKDAARMRAFVQAAKSAGQ